MSGIAMSAPKVCGYRRGNVCRAATVHSGGGTIGYPE
jgi:hypothetical protein